MKNKAHEWKKHRPQNYRTKAKDKERKPLCKNAVSIERFV
jgi:hypothetical protein